MKDVNAYPVGTKLLHIESGIHGVVLTNAFDNIDVKWENGMEAAYDKSFLDKYTKIEN